MKTKFPILTAFILSMILFNCGKKPAEETKVTEEKPAEENPYEEESNEPDGEALVVQLCFSCHNTQGTENQLAPTFAEVKDRYMQKGISRKEFVDEIVNWAMGPSEHKSRMAEARKKFGIMPQQDFDSTDVHAIAEYLYDTDLK